MTRWTLLVAACLISLPSLAVAQMPIWVTKLCRKIPVTVEELEIAHNDSAAASLQVAVGDPLEIANFADTTVYTVPVEEYKSIVKKKLNYEFSRLGAFTYGMRIGSEDQSDLPVASKSRILERVNSNYISLQLRLQRAEGGGEPYLYFKPFAAVGIFEKDDAQEFHPLMETSVRDVRGLGLFVPSGEPITAKALRTFVAVNKDVMTRKGAGNEVELVPHYELVFVRARVDGDGPELHSFVTNRHRTVINYLAPYEAPKNPEACTFDSTIYFTEYTVAKQSPSARATRSFVINTRGRYPVTEMNQYCASVGLDGTAFDNLTLVLDAIIDGKVKPTETGRVTSSLDLDPPPEEGGGSE